MIGGNGNVKGLMTFNLEKQEWNEVKSDVPFNIWFPGLLKELINLEREREREKERERERDRQRDRQRSRNGMK